MKLEANKLVQQVVGQAEAAIESSLVLIKACQNKEVMNIISEIVKRQGKPYKNHH